MFSMLKHPSAWLPIAMSLTALTMLLGFLAMHGIMHQPLVRETDEGTAAHLFQLLMGGQVPIVLFFAIKWLPLSPRQALTVLALQVVAAFAAFTPLYLLEHTSYLVQ